jgi:hypothetical protein
MRMIEVKRLYDLNLNDPFFESFKNDYKFEDWCYRNKDRKCYVKLMSINILKNIFVLQ